MSQRTFAVVGAGPSGLFTAGALIQRFPDARVDVIDRQLTPFGLVRHGVAPDHPRIKTVVSAFERILTTSGIRLLTGIEVGRDINWVQLGECYDAVVHATGAPLDRQLGIPGEHLPGVVGATAFVRWYNGHPDALPQADVLLASSVIVLGAGNVALDVARFLVRDYNELAQTDVPDRVLSALTSRRVQQVTVVARRAAAFTKFSNKELRELDKLDNVTLEADCSPESYETPNPVARETQANLDLFRSWSEHEGSSEGPRLRLRFSLRPVEVLGADHVEGVRFAITRTSEDGVVHDTGETLDIPTQAVVTCVGSAGQPLPGLPFDFDRSVVPNDRGRVLTSDGATLPAHYVAGWVKRGATGVIGTNKLDAAETVECIAEDILDTPPRPDKPSLEALLTTAGRSWYTYSNWTRIDAAELASGLAQGRSRAKIATWDELLQAAGEPCDALEDSRHG